MLRAPRHKQSHQHQSLPLETTTTPLGFLLSASSVGPSSDGATREWLPSDRIELRRFVGQWGPKTR